MDICMNGRMEKRVFNNNRFIIVYTILRQDFKKLLQRKNNKKAAYKGRAN